MKSDRQLEIGGTIDKRRYEMRLLCVIGMIDCSFCIGFCGERPKCNKNVQEFFFWQRVRYYLEVCINKYF